MPDVSIVVPCYNEQNTIGLLLTAIYQQSFDRLNMEVIIADGLSEDRTRENILQFQQAHPDISIKIVNNQRRTIPSGLNEGIRASGGEYIIRLDAHCVPQPDYIERCVEALSTGKGDNVGGVWEIQPGGPGWIPRSIAAASAHPLGVGDALYRLGGTAQVVDTVPFGSFKITLFDRIGLFNESLLTNEDYELNVRIRQAGGSVWLDPRIRSRYFARSSFNQLARQYWRYGFWKGRMIRRYPGTLRWRQLLPPLFITGLLVLSLFAIWNEGAGWLLLAVMGIYLIVLILAGIKLALFKRDFTLMIGIPLAISVMHFTWGSAFLWNYFSKPDTS
ncbi:MAG: glycosyl transferase [Chloroflexi bacterium RBG_16_52_11]|nr:MAG: glycosyl transferase [Chloroflexi bacterium RBG_16_52_11]